MGIRKRLNQLHTVLSSTYDVKQIDAAIDRVCEMLPKATKLDYFFDLPFYIIVKIVQKYFKQVENGTFDIKDDSIVRVIKRLFSGLSKQKIPETPTLLNYIYVPNTVSLVDHVDILGSLDNITFCKQLSEIYHKSNDEYGIEKDYEVEKNALRKSINFQTAIKNCDYETVLYQANTLSIDYSWRDEAEQNYLFYAIQPNNIEIIQFLLDKGCDPNCSNKEGEFVIHKAYECDFEYVKLLIKYKAFVNPQNNEGNTILHLSVINNKYNYAGYLLEHGADPNVQNNDYFTPLHYACQNNNYNLVRLLLDHGADQNKKNKLYLAPIQLTNSKEIKSLLNSYN